VQRNDVAVVSTSINAEPESYKEWASAGHLYVAGDLNTPPELQHYLSVLGGVYLSTEKQSALSFSEVIGWRNIQRRNAAILAALQAGHTYVVTVDDDNFPKPGASEFINGHTAALGQSSIATVLGSYTGFLNPGEFCIPRFHARGVPYGLSTAPWVEHVQQAPRIVVSQAQVLGDPDCDAVERICHHPDIVAVATNAIIRPGVYCAFNSQATVWHREWAPVMAVLPGIGRYDDIFASFIFARLAREYNVALHVGMPCVRQLRNEHNLQSDLIAEYWGMSHTLDFCWALDRAHISGDMPLWEAYENLIIATSNILPKRTVEFARLWVKEWKTL
jgi:hypothetical protein